MQIYIHRTTNLNIQNSQTHNPTTETNRLKHLPYLTTPNITMRE
ncbi:hypothetical protein PSEUDO8BK_30001 [Pseudomonas sp. 8BK]|nr:hypothetical protein PSEUDO8BK_30001 [Pseudomonas sp. 8BK]